ncbi:LysR substrate-binding domain-containing protein [Pleionea sp. CnH1-48]|uniref:LysR substrate-binding domain-containing protein n=1 Tax=Pleionea sp. CnH1-48 TaxID=2954494 RepID=UPI002096E618|nr:LysR substrate-binding domain-containing protein [Pleionea sp. CnH1-48]MCO7227155.1 LysR substrate-binding domain-containing protein [Pleionea sp. CnH1-48]
MNLRDLKYLVAVADLKSFSQAAEQCHVSQPTLSTQLKKMEQYLDVELFERTNKKVLITDNGEKIIASARRILAEVEQINRVAESSKEPQKGTLKMGAFPTVASYLLPSYVSFIKKEYPLLKLLLVEEKTEVLLEQLANGELDCAILALPVNDDQFENIELFEDDFLLAVPTEHPLSSKASIQLKELEQQKLLLLTEGHCLRSQALDICKQVDSDEEDFRATSMETLRAMVAAGSGITLIPSIAKKDNDNLAYINFDDPKPSRHIALVWRTINPKKELIHQLGQALKQMH